MKTESTRQIFAVDVAKDDLYTICAEASFRIPNSQEGYEKIFERCAKCENPLVVFEASGGYERPLAEFMRDKETPVSILSPSRLRAFATSEGIKAKSDPLDTEMIYRFAEEKQVKPTLVPSPKQSEMRDLLDRRNQLVEMLAREKSREQKPCLNKGLKASVKKTMSFLEKEIARIEGEIGKLVAGEKELKKAVAIMEEVKGVGKITAWTVLGYLPEMLIGNRRQIAALAGLAPFNYDSGRMKGKRRICGGRAKIREVLYMATVSAANCNNVIRPFVQRLRAQGKPYKCAIVAAMRKLLIHLQSLLKKAEISLAF